MPLSHQKILLLGAGGQLGRELLVSLASLGEIIGTIRQDSSRPELKACQVLDLQDFAALGKLLRELRPTVVVNAAAYTAVDRAESEFPTARDINGRAVGLLAEECGKLRLPLIHYSTDYVFDGRGITAWTEEDATGPLNAYGRSKLLGEVLIGQSDPPHLIARTSWVYGAQGQNFVKTMLRLGRDRNELRVVADQIGAPTSARALAEVTAKVIAQCGDQVADVLRESGGLMHIACSGETSWHGFAEEIFRLARAAGFPLKLERVLAIPTSDYPTPAERPLNSRLDCSKLAANFGLTMPSWQEALAASFPEILQAMS